LLEYYSESSLFNARTGANNMNVNNYPFAQELITDIQGHIQKVIINFKDYEKIIETFEDSELLRSMIEVKDETPLSIEEALVELEKE
jgi:hypothetical protein